MNLFEQEMASKPMRDHQEKFIHDVREAAKHGHKRIMGCASVGWGKTLVSANLFKSGYHKGKMSMFTVPRNALIEPSVEEFEGEGLSDIGIIQQDHPRTNAYAKLQVASIHTAINRELPRLDFVIVDEAHLCNKSFLKLLDSSPWADRIVIGLSATPWKRGMGFRWTKLIQTKKTAQLIDEGYLVKPRYLVGAEEPKTEGLKTHLDDEGNKVLSEDDEAAVMGDKLIIGDVVQTWVKHAENRPSFYYCVNLAHARKLREEFEREGVTCGYVDGSMTRDVRTKVLRMYREGRFKIVVNYGVLTTGIDEDVRCIGICRIIKSEIDWVQIIGRGLRTDNPRKRVIGMEPKVDCLVIDHGGNLTRDDGTALPPAEEIYHDYLDTTDPKSKKKPFQDDPKPATHRKCAKCGALIPPKTLRCPGCGDESFSTNSGVRTVDAEFHEFGKERPRVAHRDAKQVFYSELLEIARRRGYQDGWVAHTYRRKFSVWPRNLERVPISHPRGKTWDFVQQDMRKRAAELHQAQPVQETPPGVTLEEEVF